MASVITPGFEGKKTRNVKCVDLGFRDRARYFYY
eukprot:COSAG01_NODE_75816_length_192_cov_142.655914_1_plen_33_part_01